MAEPHPFSVDRREFLQAGVAASAVAASLSAGPVAADEKDRADENKPVLPKKRLGKTGVDVTILNQGTVGQPDALERLLRVAYREGVRYFDTAAGYRNAEVVFGDWFQAAPEVRKNIFLATKTEITGKPSDMLKVIDTRLDRLKTDHIDLLFFHQLSTAQVDWPKSKEMREAVEAIKKTGKVKFVGFSTHDDSRADQIKNAAEGGFIDVIMLMHNPWIEKDSPLNKALDAAHARGIGLVSMKQIAGQALQVTADRVPSLKARNLTPVQGLLHAIWSDERFSATCVTMKNLDQTRENVDAARRFEPLKQVEFDELRAAVLAAGPTLCPNCDGRCAQAAGTKASLCDLTRFYTYYEDHGIRSHARECYAGLSDLQRDWKGADLEAARRACHNQIDFAKILPEVDRLLG